MSDPMFQGGLQDQAFRLLDEMGVEMMLHMFSWFCTPADILRVGETTRSLHNWVRMFPLSLSRFPLGSHVCIKRKEDILHAFEITNRIGLTMSDAEEIAGHVALVAGKHPTNGVGVHVFESTSETPLDALVWLEPMCLAHIGAPPLRDTESDVRLFPGQKVRVNVHWSNFFGQVGTVDVRADLPPGVHHEVMVRYAGQSEELIDQGDLEPATSFFGGAVASTTDQNLSLRPFVVGCLVGIREKDHVMAGFDKANRDDYFTYMDQFCETQGVVDMLHPTNGVRVRLAPSLSLWYEPPCLKIMLPDASTQSEDVGRLFVGQRVRLESTSSSYHGRVGLIQLHFYQKDYTKVTVRFSDGHEEHVDASCVTLVRSYF